MNKFTNLKAGVQYVIWVMSTGSNDGMTTTLRCNLSDDSITLKSGETAFVSVDITD